MYRAGRLPSTKTLERGGTEGGPGAVGEPVAAPPPPPPQRGNGLVV